MLISIDGDSPLPAQPPTRTYTSVQAGSGGQGNDGSIFAVFL
ncbi:MAG: hypothetical protein WD048_01650 [Chitinophagales bacterium]